MITKIINGTIIDGTGTQPFQGELLLEDDKISEIGPVLNARADGVIDAAGYVVCPGFIDSHSHSGLKAISQPHMIEKISQGITTEIVGQDGIFAAPIAPELVPAWKGAVHEIDGQEPWEDWGFCATMKGYLDALEASGPSANFAVMTPHGNLRMGVAGFEARQLTPDEIHQMESRLEQSFREGSLGLSTGLIYPPCAFADRQELVALCRVTASAGGVFAVHQRSEANDILRSLQEIISIARETGVRVQISHFKICGARNQSKLPDILALLLDARQAGFSVTFDQYPYIAGSTAFSMILPPWAHEGGLEATIRYLRDPEARARIREDILEVGADWDNFIEFAGYDGISISRARNPSYIGKTLTELGRMLNMDPLEAAMDILAEEGGGVGMIDVYGSEDTLEALMHLPEQNFCTDGVLGESPHPRVWGSYPRILARYVRERGALTAPDAIRRMSGQAALAMGLSNRGLIQPGYFADLVMYDPNKVGDTATFADPVRTSTGIQCVLVNGRAVISNGIPTGESAGRVLRKEPLQ